MPVLDVALWLLSHGKWREVGVLSISVGQKQEPLASCSRNEKVFFFFSELAQGFQAGRHHRADIVWCYCEPA